MPHMKILTKVIYFWGICDLIFVLIYISSSISNEEIPLYTEILFFLKLFNSPSTSTSYLGVASLLFFLTISIPVSAYLLLRQHKAAAIMCYFQFPVRVIIGYSSLPFVRSDMGIYQDYDLFPFIIIIEFIKLATIIIWHRNKLKVVGEIN